MTLPASATTRCRLDRIIRLIYHRLFEWMAGLMMLGVGLHLLLWHSAMANSSFDYVLRYVPEALLAWWFLGIGGARIGALIVNGASPHWGPKVRGAASSLSAIVWAQLAYALYVHSVAGDIPPSPGIPIYGILVLCELFVTYKAAADVRATR